jgi:hypothetical protein
MLKLYNDQRNAQVFNYLSIYLSFTCFGLSISPSSEAGVQLRHWRICAPASEDGLKESPKHVRQK